MISVVKVDEKIKWDSIVKSFKDYEVHYLNGYVQAFKVYGDGEPILIYYNDDNTRGVNVIFKRDISKLEKYTNVLPANEYFDIITPYGYGGFIIEGDNYNKLNTEYNDFCMESGYISEFIRFSLFSEYRDHYDGKAEKCMHNIVRLLDIDIEEIYMNFEHKVRKNIKKANKNNINIEIDSSGEKLDEFLNIYYMTMDRTSASKSYYFSKEFFKIINTMTGNFIYFFALVDNEIISAELVLYDTKNCYSFLGGTDDKFFTLRPNELLKYDIIKWAKNIGLKNFVLGGGHGDDDGIFKYKKSFAPDGIKDFYVGKKIFNDKVYNNLVELRSKDEKFNWESDFFPKYRS